MFEHSPTTEKLDAALAKVQAKIKPAIKDSHNPHFGKAYADLNSNWEAARAALGEFGVAVTQWPLHSENNRLSILTRVSHAGEFYQATFSMPVPKQDPQGYGSAITYARRFTLAPALGIAPNDDDDGNSSSQPPYDEPRRPEPAPRPFSAPAPFTPSATKPAIILPKKVTTQVADSEEVKRRVHVMQLAKTAHWSVDQVHDMMIARFDREKLIELTAPQYQELCAEIASRPRPALAGPGTQSGVQGPNPPPESILESQGGFDDMPMGYGGP